MIFARIEDVTNGIEVLVFPRTLKEDPDVWQEDRVIMMNCKLSDKDGESKLICNKAKEIDPEKIADIIYELDQFKEEDRGSRYKYKKKKTAEDSAPFVGGNVYILVPPAVDNVLNESLKKIFDKHKGIYRVFLAIKNDAGYKKVSTNFMVDGSDQLKNEVVELLGERTYKLVEN